MNFYEETFLNIIRLNIKLRRIELGMTQAKLAEIANLSCDYIAEIESLKKNKVFSILTLFNICKSLKINIIDFINF